MNWENDSRMPEDVWLAPSALAEVLLGSAERGYLEVLMLQSEGVVNWQGLCDLNACRRIQNPKS